jgi:hypothetical protein
MTRLSVTLTALVLTAGCMHTGRAKGPPADQGTVARPEAQSSTDAAGIASFNTRLREYAALHDRLEKTLPPLPNETSSEALDKHQRELAAMLARERQRARRSDLFTREGEKAIRKVLRQVFVGPDGARLKATIMDENPAAVKLAVNGRYPDAVPLSTMPPQVLAVLPKLPDELEYRFIGHRLILFDVHAHTVADYIENALP